MVKLMSKRLSYLILSSRKDVGMYSLQLVCDIPFSHVYVTQCSRNSIA